MGSNSSNTEWPLLKYRRAFIQLYLFDICKSSGALFAVSEWKFQQPLKIRVRTLTFQTQASVMPQKYLLRQMSSFEDNRVI